MESKLSSNKNAVSLLELAKAFFKLGSTAFGGPAAHIAMMEEDLVRRKKWISKDEFLDLLGATNLIPGPNSTEMAIHIGYKKAGGKGLLVAGASFIFPAFIIVWIIAWFYVKFGTIPAFQSVFVAIKPIILAVIAQAIFSLSKNAIKDKFLGVLALAALVLYLLGVSEILILFLIAMLNLVLRNQIKTIFFVVLSWMALSIYSLPLKAAEIGQQRSEISLEKLMLVFVKIGSVLFGSGYVLIAFLQSEFVDRLNWINQQQLIDAIAVGQFTPGPVFTTATFIGYVIAGHSGAVLSTVGIFAPAFFFVAISAPFLHRLRQSKFTAPILDGLNVASLSLMIGAVFLLAKNSVVSIYGLIAFSISLVCLIGFKINSAWLIFIAGIIGYFKIAG